MPSTTQTRPGSVNQVFSDTNKLDKRSFTNLHKAVVGLLPLDLKSELQRLSQVAIDKPDADGRTALSRAAIRGVQRAVGLLLAHHANFHIPSRNGSAPLHWAVQSLNPLAVELLLNSGANVSQANNRGYTPLHFAAAKQNNPAVLQLLCSFGANMDVRTRQGDSPLMNAARANNPGNVAYLVKVGCHLNLQNKDGMTPLAYALCFNSHDCLDVLLRSAADQALRRNEGSSLLHLAAIYADQRSLEILGELGELQGVVANVVRGDGSSALQLAEWRAGVDSSWKKVFRRVYELVTEKGWSIEGSASDTEEERLYDAIEYQ
jgi:ankyrin repeat protein